MAADPDEGIVTDLMLGTMIAFGADIIIFVGIAWVAGYVPTIAFVAVTILVVSVYATWVGWRWREIKKLESIDRSPIEEIKYQYASGEISEKEFERKLDTLIDNSTSDERKHESIEPSTEKSK